MKTTTIFRAAVLAAAILSVSVSCQSTDPVAMPPATDCEPNYHPPAMIPGTNCRNFCRHVYEGTIDLAVGEWVINCETQKLENPRLSVKLDRLYVSNADGEYLPALRFRYYRPGINFEEAGDGVFCRRDAYVRSGGQEGHLLFASFSLGDGIVEEMTAVFQESVGSVRFRILTRVPLPLEEVEERN